MRGNQEKLFRKSFDLIFFLIGISQLNAGLELEVYHLQVVSTQSI